MTDKSRYFSDDFAPFVSYFLRHWLPLATFILAHADAIPRGFMFCIYVNGLPGVYIHTNMTKAGYNRDRECCFGNFNGIYTNTRMCGHIPWFGLCFVYSAIIFHWEYVNGKLTIDSWLKLARPFYSRTALNFRITAQKNALVFSCEDNIPRSTLNVD